MPVDAFEKTGDPKDLGSQFLTEKEKKEIKAGVSKKAPKRGRKK